VASLPFPKLLGHLTKSVSYCIKGQIKVIYEGCTQCKLLYKQPQNFSLLGFSRFSMYKVFECRVYHIWQKNSYFHARSTYFFTWNTFCMYHLSEIL